MGFEKTEQFKTALAGRPGIAEICAATHDFGNGGWVISASPISKMYISLLRYIGRRRLHSRYENGSCARSQLQRRQHIRQTSFGDRKPGLRKGIRVGTMPSVKRYRKVKASEIMRLSA